VKGSTNQKRKKDRLSVYSQGEGYLRSFITTKRKREKLNHSLGRERREASSMRKKRFLFEKREGRLSKPGGRCPKN